MPSVWMVPLTAEKTKEGIQTDPKELQEVLSSRLKELDMFPLVSLHAVHRSSPAQEGGQGFRAGVLPRSKDCHLREPSPVLPFRDKCGRCVMIQKNTDKIQKNKALPTGPNNAEAFRFLYVQNLESL